MSLEKIIEFLTPYIQGISLFEAILLIICVSLGALVYKFADQLIKSSAEKLAKGEHISITTIRIKRKESIAKINRLLRELLNKVRADRVAVFEYHNGGYNLTGLPFMHFTLALQLNTLGVDELSKDFENVSISSVPDFISALDKTDIVYVKDIEELRGTFPRLYRELNNDGMKSAAFCNIEGVDEQIGFLMLAYKDTSDITQKKIQRELFRKTQKIASFLDGKR